jgi:glycolate oxidase FAD binding subunit
MATVAIRNCTTADGLALVRRAASFPLEPTGLAYLPAAACAHSPALKSADLSQTNGIALVRVEGAEDPVIDKIARLRNEFAKLDVTVLEDEESALLFAEIGDGAAFAEHDSAVWRLFVPPSAALAAVSASEANFWYADWAGEVLWLELPASREIDERLRKIAREFGGHAMLMRASSAARTRLNVFEPEPPARAALSRTVKAAFDPSHLFNPGRMFEDI